MRTDGRAEHLLQHRRGQLLTGDEPVVLKREAVTRGVEPGRGDHGAARRDGVVVAGRRRDRRRRTAAWRRSAGRGRPVRRSPARRVRSASRASSSSSGGGPSRRSRPARRPGRRPPPSRPAAKDIRRRFGARASIVVAVRLGAALDQPPDLLKPPSGIVPVPPPAGWVCVFAGCVCQSAGWSACRSARWCHRPRRRWTAGRCPDCRS